MGGVKEGTVCIISDVRAICKEKVDCVSIYGQQYPSEINKDDILLNTTFRDKALIIFKYIITNSKRNIFALEVFSRLLRNERFQISAQESYYCRALTLVCQN